MKFKPLLNPKAKCREALKESIIMQPFTIKIMLKSPLTRGVVNRDTRTLMMLSLKTKRIAILKIIMIIIIIKATLIMTGEIKVEITIKPLSSMKQTSMMMKISPKRAIMGDITKVTIMRGKFPDLRVVADPTMPKMIKTQGREEAEECNHSMMTATRIP